MADNLPVPATPDPWTPMMLAKLAREIVYEIKPVDQILAVFKLSQADYERIQQMPFFTRAVEQFAIEWNGADSAQKRIRLQMQAALEDALPHLGALMTHPDVTATAKIEAAKWFSKADEGRGGAASGEKFVINIDLGGDQKVKMEVQPRTVEGVTEDVPALSQEVRDAIPLQSLGKGS